MNDIQIDVTILGVCVSSKLDSWFLLKLINSISNIKFTRRFGSGVFILISIQRVLNEFHKD